MVDEPDVVRLSCAFRPSIGPFFRIACSRLSSVALTSCTSSAEQPVDLSYNIDELSQAAGLARKKKMYSTRKFTILFSRSVTRPFCGEVVTET